MRALKYSIVGALILPTTAIYFYAIATSLSTLSIWKIIPITLFGYGIYCVWNIAIKYNNYKTSKLPRHIVFGLALGAIEFLFLLAFMLTSHEGKPQKELWETLITIYICGGGPALLSAIIIIKLKSNKLTSQ